MNRRISWSAVTSFALGLYALLILLFVYGPTLIIPVFSLNDAVHIAFPLKGFTLRWYEQLLADGQMHAALANSFRVAAPVAVICTVLGTLAAKSISRYRLPGQGAMMGFMMLPMAIPSLLAAISLMMLMRFLGVTLSLFTVGFGHLLLCVPLSIVVMISQLEGFDKSLEEAARDLGETRWATFWRVTFPLILPGLVASLFLTFAVSFDEFLLSLFLSGTQTTLPVYIWSQMRFPDKLPGVLALATIILAVTFTLAAVAEWLRRSANRRLAE